MCATVRLLLLVVVLLPSAALPESRDEVLFWHKVWSLCLTTKTFEAFRDGRKGDTDLLFQECKSDEDQFVAALREASPATFGKMDDEELRRSLRERWMQDIVDAHRKK
jgi:hypothetical protein